MLDSKLVDPTEAPEEISDSETSIDNSNMDSLHKKQRKRKQSSSGGENVAKRRKPKSIDAKREAPQFIKYDGLTTVNPNLRIHRRTIWSSFPRPGYGIILTDRGIK